MVCYSWGTNFKPCGNVGLKNGYVFVLSGFCGIGVPVAGEGAEEWVFYTLVNPQVDGNMLKVIGS